MSTVAPYTLMLVGKVIPVLFLTFLRSPPKAALAFVYLAGDLIVNTGCP